MYMPMVQGFKFIVQGLEEITTNNGPSIVAALDWLWEWYHITHIRIAAYNSQANGTVEVSHRYIRDGIVKACGSDIRQWTRVTPYVFWADRITVRRDIGYSPYYASHADLAQIHDRVVQSCFKSVEAFCRYHKNVIKDYKFKAGNLILVLNKRIGTGISKKALPRYFGPMVIVKRTCEGNYRLAELTGAISRLQYAVFRIIPYHSRSMKRIKITEFLDKEALDSMDSEAVDD
ncbi:hypothetical protein F5879DRAFT_978801 [Lentinula edodes]|nr:hypothetical protein F5879DRAFT_978801 [Lentinula edodes]